MINIRPSVLLIVLFLASFYSIAQEGDSGVTVIKADTTPPEPPDYKMKKFKVAMMFGFNNYGSTADSALHKINNGVSRTASVGGHFKFRFHQESKWYFKTGLELGWNNYMLSDTAARIRKNDSLGMVEFYQDTVNWRKSKFTRAMITIPFMLEFNSSMDGKKDGFKFGIGPYVGFKVASYQVAKRSTSFAEQDNGAEPKITLREGDDLYMNGLRLGAMAMLGAEEFNLFVRYDFTKVFQSNKGPEQNTLSFGILFQ